MNTEAYRLPDETFQGTDFRVKNLLYECVVGSKAYGLDGPTSDDDIRGIYTYPRHAYEGLADLGSDRLPRSFHPDKGVVDLELWELKHFLALALKGNPSIMDALNTPFFTCYSPLAEELRQNRQRFYSERMFPAYTGYSYAQLNRLERSHALTGVVNWKNAMHMLRIMFQARELFDTGMITTDLNHQPDVCDFLLKVKAGEVPMTVVMDKRQALFDHIDTAYGRHLLPAVPDHDYADQFLKRVRRWSERK